MSDKLHKKGGWAVAFVPGKKETGSRGKEVLVCVCVIYFVCRAYYVNLNAE